MFHAQLEVAIALYYPEPAPVYRAQEQGEEVGGSQIECDEGGENVVLDEKTREHSLNGKLLSCQVQIIHTDEAIDKLFKDWKFSGTLEQGEYAGQIVDADRMRFLNAISHIANYIRQLTIT